MIFNLTQVSSRILQYLQASSNFSCPIFRTSLLLFKICRKCFTARTPKSLVTFHIYNLVNDEIYRSMRSTEKMLLRSTDWSIS